MSAFTFRAPPVPPDTTGRDGVAARQVEPARSARRVHHGAALACALLLHIAALWGLKIGAADLADPIVPAEILVEMLTLEPLAQSEPPKQPPTPAVERRARAVPARQAAPVPAPVAAPAPVPADNRPSEQSTPLHTTAGAVTAPAAPPAPQAAPSRSNAPALPAFVPPSSTSDEFDNPKPPYPALSRRLGEQGQVLVRVLVGVDGSAQKAEVKQSSGHDRLDQAALSAVLRWRYTPAKRAGVAEAMWFSVPINFVLE